MTARALPRDRLVEAAGAIIADGSKSFRSASKLFDRTTRERSWLLYAWCRACDDRTDGQALGHGAQAIADPAGAQQAIERLTAQAMTGDPTGEVPFDALALVARERGIPDQFVADHLAGFRLDSAGWRPETEDDLLLYCYHVAGAVGAMMAVVMGIDPGDRDTIDRAIDLGIAFQLANIARDIVPDAAAGRVYVPGAWLAERGLVETELADPANGGRIAPLARRLVELSRRYRHSARVGAARLPFRARLAVLAAANVYGAIGDKVVRRGGRAWDSRTIISKAEKLWHFSRALGEAMASPPLVPRDGLWSLRPADLPAA